MNSSPEKSLDDAASGRPMKAVGIEDEQEAAGGFASFVRIFTYARRADYLTLSAALLATFVSGAAMALVNLVVGEFVNILGHFATGASSPEQFRASAAEYSLLFVYIGIARLAGVYLYASLSTYAAYHTTRNLRHAYLRAALSQEVAFFDRGVVGSISAQATSNGRLIQSGIAEKLGMVFQALATFVGAFIIAFIVDWKLTLILLCIAPALLLVMGIVAGADSKVETQMLKVQAQGASFAETILSSARNVNAFGLRARLMYRFEEYLEEAFRLGMKKNAIYGALFSAEFTIVYLGIALAFWQGLKLTVEGDIPNVGVVYTVMMCVVSATISITAVAPSTVAFSRAATAAAELFKLIDRPSEINPFGKSGEKPAQIDGSLEFDGVTFAYPTRPGVNVLKEFSLHIPAGKMTALVGMSGSGKSTCIGLLERWYNPAAGSIKLDGRSISELNLNWLRTNIRLVQQEPVLFNGTVFENIANGLVGTPLEKASPAEQQASIESAAAAAFAHDFITALPDGYQTRIGERGGLLSGGQKQRIAIARSIVSNPRILLLDEATSALDPHAEGIVQQALDNASRERTTVVIAHKLATIRGADNIVVMAAGEMMEQGTHDQLLARGEAGAYFRMVKAQMLSNKMAASPDQEDDSGAVGKSVDSSDDEGKKQGDGGQGDAVMDDVAQAQSIVRYKTVEREHAVLLQNREDFERYQRSGFVRTIIKMIADSTDLKWVYLVVFVTCITAGGLITIQAVILAQSLNVFNSPDLASAVPRGNFLATMFIVLAVGCFVSWFANGWATNIMAQTLSRKVRRTLLDGFLRQDLRFFDRDENTVGALTSRLDSHPQSVLELMGFNLGIMLSSMVSVLASSILAIAVSWKLGLVGVFAGLPPLLAAGWLRIRLETRMETTADARFSNSASLASESIMAIRTVSSLATEEAVLKKYTSELDKATASLKRPLFAMMIWYAFTQSAEYFVLALGFWYGARQMSFGEATFYEFFVAFIGVFFAGQQAGILLSFSSSFTKGLYAANYYFWLQNLEPTIRETDENRDKGPRDNVSSMALDQVRFAYPLRPDSQVLRRVSLKVRPGSFVALVGASGCGKSTAMALLERFYDPSKGTILVDDADNLRELNPRLYRQQISLVQQEPTLYPGSIRDNVAYGVDVADDEVARGNHLHPGAKAVSDDKIEAALRAANAWDFVCSLPEGTRTVCGTSGSQLSGGQRQRIAIARALIRDPRVLLLDEATSALDTESEKVVQAALADAARAGGRITVAVAHRLSTVRDADLICVFYAGKIAESGTHEELLAMRGLYSKMCEAQSL